DPSTGIASATIPDDGSIPDGTHMLQALAWDVAGNQATITQGQAGAPESVTLPLRIQTAIAVAAGQVMKPTCTTKRHVTRRAHGHGAFRAAAARLLPSCRLVPVPGAKRDMLVRYGQQQTLHGQLKTLDGSPLSGATMTVTASSPGWPPRTLGTVITNADGDFTYTVPAVASETVSFTYQGTNTLREIAQTATIRVIGRAQLRVARPAVAGRPILFTGHVLGGFIPPGGAQVQLEYRIKGVPLNFAPFGPLIYTNPHGHFAFRRPMATNAGGYTYLFRAVVERQNGWPFLTTATNVVARHVRR
ncbi:MAG: Ig-like domain-containing protein, partial [Solirubrobacteraceae bacterium]